jgi:hypothetical protein
MNRAAALAARRLRPRSLGATDCWVATDASESDVSTRLCIRQPGWRFRGGDLRYWRSRLGCWGCSQCCNKADQSGRGQQRAELSNPGEEELYPCEEELCCAGAPETRQSDAQKPKARSSPAVPTSDAMLGAEKRRHRRNSAGSSESNDGGAVSSRPNSTLRTYAPGIRISRSNVLSRGKARPTRFRSVLRPNAAADLVGRDIRLAVGRASVRLRWRASPVRPRAGFFRSDVVRCPGRFARRRR